MFVPFFPTNNTAAAALSLFMKEFTKYLLDQCYPRHRSCIKPRKITVVSLTTRYMLFSSNLQGRLLLIVQLRGYVHDCKSGVTKSQNLRELHID